MPKKENTTKSFVLRVDAATMDAIEKWAADEFRSTNGQLQWIINEALRKSGRLKKSNRKEKEGECPVSADRVRLFTDRSRFPASIGGLDIYTVSDSADWGLVFSGTRYVGNGNVAFIFGVGMQYVCSSPILPFCISDY